MVVKGWLKGGEQLKLLHCSLFVLHIFTIFFIFDIYIYLYRLPLQFFCCCLFLVVVCLCPLYSHCSIRIIKRTENGQTYYGLFIQPFPQYIFDLTYRNMSAFSINMKCTRLQHNSFKYTAIWQLFLSFPFLSPFSPPTSHQCSL